jgi:hypothetical protein
MPSHLKTLFDEQGYVIVPGLIPEEQLPRLKEACDRVISRTREGKWPYRRTVGKQFPPFDENSPDSWGVQHIMHPDLGEPAFASWYTSDRLLDIVQTLLECDEEKLQMGTWTSYRCILPPQILPVLLLQSYSICLSTPRRMTSRCVGIVTM